MGRPGRPPLAASTRAAIERLLAEGCSRRAIARRLGVGRTTVRNVARGQAPQACPPRLAAEERRARAGERCGECGAALEVAPCRACRTRRYLAERQRQIAELLEQSEAARRQRLADFLAGRGIVPRPAPRLFD